MDALPSRIDAILHGHEEKLAGLLERGASQQRLLDQTLEKLSTQPLPPARGAGDGALAARPGITKLLSSYTFQTHTQNGDDTSDEEDYLEVQDDSAAIDVNNQTLCVKVENVWNDLKGLLKDEAFDTSFPISVKADSVRREKLHFTRRLIRDRRFEHACAFLIIANAAFMGVQIAYGNPDDDRQWQFFYVHAAFMLIFTVEMCLRLAGERAGFFCNDNAPWNIFDTVLVLSSLYEFFTIVSERSTSANLSGARTMRVLKTVRVVRILRVSRYLRELRIMAASIVLSMRSLVWALILYGMVTYVFAITLTQASIEYVSLNHGSIEADQLLQHFGTISRSLNTLLQVTFQGNSWGVLKDQVLSCLHWFYTGIFLFYILFMSLCMLNVVTGVFVGTAIESAYEDVDTIIQDELADQNSATSKLQQLFREADIDNTGQLDSQTFQLYLDDKRVKAYLAKLGLNIREATDFFRLLDRSSLGKVNANDFIIGCLKLKGPASNVDVHTVLHENRRMVKVILMMMRGLEEHIQALNGPSASSLVRGHTTHTTMTTHTHHSHHTRASSHSNQSGRSAGASPKHTATQETGGTRIHRKGTAARFGNDLGIQAL